MEIKRLNSDQKKIINFNTELNIISIRIKSNLKIIQIYGKNYLEFKSLNLNE
jgi:hypothetical protein